MARWEAEQQRDYLQDYGVLSSSIGRASGQQATKSTRAKVGAMVGAVGLPLAVALSPFTAGQSLTFWSAATLAGIGSLAGGYAGSKTGGKDIDIDTGKTFLKEESIEAQNRIELAKEKRTKDMWSQAGLDAITAGIFKGGGLDAFKELGAKTLSSEKLLGEEGTKTLFQNLGWLGTKSPDEDWVNILKGAKSEELVSQIKNPFTKSSWLKGTSEYPGYLGTGKGIDILRDDEGKTMLQQIGQSFEKVKESTGDWWTTKSEERLEKNIGTMYDPSIEPFEGLKEKYAAKVAEVREHPLGWKASEERRIGKEKATKSMFEQRRLSSQQKYKQELIERQKAGGAYGDLQASAGLPSNVPPTGSSVIDQSSQSTTKGPVKDIEEYGTIKKTPSNAIQAMIDTGKEQEEFKNVEFGDEVFESWTQDKQDKFMDWMLEQSSTWEDAFR